MRLSEALEIFEKDIADQLDAQEGGESTEIGEAAIAILNAAAQGRLKEREPYSAGWAAFFFINAMIAAICAHQMWVGQATFWQGFCSIVTVSLLCAVWAMQALCGWRADD